MNRRCKVIGLGNPYRQDDGIGLRVVESLADRRLPGHPELIAAGQAGLSLISLIDQAGDVILVDCAEMDQPPGTVCTFSPAELVEEEVSGLHAARTATAIRMADRLGMLPDRLVLVGVQPAGTSWGNVMSEVVEAAIPVACDTIETLLRPDPEYVRLAEGG